MALKTEKTKKEQFAVIATGGKQYLVSAGDTVKIEKITGNFKAGDKLTFDKVLMTDDGSTANIGAPYLSGAKVEGKLLEIGKHDKIEVFKYKAKSRYQKMRGHRQPYFKVEITAVK